MSEDYDINVRRGQRVGGAGAGTTLRGVRPGACEGPLPITASDHLHRVVVDGHTLVFDPVAHRAHLLNPSAVLVLDLLDGRPIDDVVTACADAAGRAPGDVAAEVVAAVDVLVAEGLVATDPGSTDPGSTDVARGAPSSGRPPGANPIALTSDERVDLAGTHRTRRFRGIETAFVIEADAALVARLDELLVGLVDAPAGGGSLEGPSAFHRYVVAADGTTATIALDGRRVTRLPQGPLVVQHLLWHIDRLITEEATHHLLLHAGAVVVDDGIVVLAGVMDSGKSTLTAALVQTGFAFVTDEIVAIDLDDRLVTPFARPITLEAGSWGLFPAATAALAVDGDDAPRSSRRYLTPDGPLAGARRGVTHVVFPEFVADSALTLEAVTPAQAALELTQHTFTLDHRGLAAIADLVERVPCVRLRHPGIEVAVPALASWLSS